MRHVDPPSSDADLLAESQRDADAFHAVYVRHASRVHGHLLRQTGNREAAEDLTAETFARAWIGRGRFRDEAGGSAVPWLLGIARNVLLSSVRRASMEQDAVTRMGLRDRLDRPASDAQPSDAWLSGIDDVLDLLPPDQRAALHARIVDDGQYAEVARRLGTTEPTARMRVHRALSTLRTTLGNQGPSR